MLHLSRKVLFAIEAVLDIAYHTSSEPVQSKEITRRQGIPRRYLEQALQHLVRDGILLGVRGPKGGYRLARPATDINVRDIITVFEGSIALTECNLDGVLCDQSDVCSTSDNWKRINVAVLEALEAISLADMTEQDFVPVFRLQRGMALTEVH